VLNSSPLAHADMQVCWREWDPLLLRVLQQNLMCSLLMLQQCSHITIHSSYLTGRTRHLIHPEEMCACCCWFLTFQLPIAHSQAMPPCQYSRWWKQPCCSFSGTYQCRASMDDASTLSGTEKGDAKSTRLIHNYFLKSLAVRNYKNSCGGS